MRIFRLLACLIGTLFVFQHRASATSYLVNGSFETGSYSPWVFSGYGDGVVSGTRIDCPTCAFSHPYTAEDGSHYVEAGAVGSDSYLTQSFHDTAGESLTVSGWVIGNGTAPSHIKFNFNGVTYINIDPVPDEPWTRYTFNVVATGYDTLQIASRNDPSGDGFDNFSVTTAVPEPATWLLLSLGFLVLASCGYVGETFGKRTSTSTSS